MDRSDLYCPGEFRRKFHAIANLDVIYRNAFEVTILLEDFDISVEEESALSLLHAEEYGPGLHDSFHLGGLEIEENIQICFDAGYGNTLVGVMGEVFENRWFDRAWCRHEYMLNSNAIFIVVSGRRFSSVTISPSTFPETFIQLRYHGIEFDLHVLFDLAFQDFSFGINDQTTDYTTEGCLFELFVQLQRLSCSYERDVISICLNASGIRLSFNDDIVHQRECRHLLAMAALSAGDASVLRGEGLPTYRMDCPGHQPVICWPRAYQDDWPRFTTRSMPRICDDARIWHISPERVSMDNFFFLSRPSTPPTKFRESAAELLSLLEIKSEICISILSCAFAFGLRWIDMAFGNLKELLGRHLGVDNEISFQTIMSSVTRHCLSNEVSMPTQGISNPFRIAQFVYLLAKFNTCFANTDNTTPLAVRLNSVGTGWAILLVPKYLARDITSGKYRIAVPVALNTMETLSVRRA